MTTMTNKPIETWLTPLDAAPLECDGMARTVSLLLHREGLGHTIMVGTVEVEGVGTIDPHFWIELSTGAIIDFRARMWLRGSELAPHGVFDPTPGVRYVPKGAIDSTLPEFMFEVLTGVSMSHFPSLDTGLSTKTRPPRP